MPESTPLDELTILEGFCPKHDFQMFPPNPQPRKLRMGFPEWDGKKEFTFSLLCGCTWTWKEKP